MVAARINSPVELRSMQLVRQRPWAIPVALVLIGLVVLTILGLYLTPWQQTVQGAGEMSVYSAMDRPQNIEAQIPGRLVSWKINEGDFVEEGQELAVLDDIDSKFLDVNQLARLQSQRRALQDQLKAANERVARLEKQAAFQGSSQGAQVPAAGERFRQTQERLKQARQRLTASEKTLAVARDVARSAASERLRQAEERVRQAEQTLIERKQTLETAQYNFNRIKNLYERPIPLRSQRDYEVAQRDLVAATTAVESAGAALEVAKRDTKVGNLAQAQAELEYARAQAQYTEAQAAVEVARRDTNIGTLDVDRITADTNATITATTVAIQSAYETIQSITNNIYKLDVDLENLRQRTKQQRVVAPRSGQIVRLLRVGPGETVKAGDVMAVLVPNTTDHMVELKLSDNDAPLVKIGDPVRLQFAGYPALQFSGFPSVSVGTFGGRVKAIDAVDDGTNQYRLIVEPESDEERVRRKDQPWPPLNSTNPGSVRPGAQVIGWVMLREVRLGYELWRQFNAFPPSVDRDPIGYVPKKGKGEDKEKKKSDEEKFKGDLKRKAKSK